MKRLMIFLLAFVLVVSFSGMVLAVPNIDSAPTTISDGQSVVVTGGGFGVKSTAAPIKWVDFDDATSGQSLVSYDPYWSEGNNAPMMISNEDMRIGNNIKAELKASDPGSQSSMVWRDNVGFADTGKIYLNFWLRMDFGTAITDGYFQVKNVEVAVGSNEFGNGNMIMPMLSINHFAYPGPPPYTQCLLGNYRSSLNIKGDITNGTNIIKNVDYGENSIVIDMNVIGPGILGGTKVIDFNTANITLSTNATASAIGATFIIYAPSDPTIYFPNNFFDRFNPSWQNVILQADMGDPGIANGSKWYWASLPNFTSPYVRVGANKRPILDAVADKMNAIKIGWYRSGYVNGAIAAGTSVVQYDNIYIDNSWARVEIGDNANYDSCTHREIQIPTIWSDGSITINVNQGSFNDGEQAYLFVVDENGVASNGYLVTLGSGLSNCGDADADEGGSVSITELINYISQWKAGSVLIGELITAIGEWKNGCS